MPTDPSESNERVSAADLERLLSRAEELAEDYQKIQRTRTIFRIFELAVVLFVVITICFVAFFPAAIEDLNLRFRPSELYGLTLYVVFFIGLLEFVVWLRSQQRPALERQIDEALITLTELEYIVSKREKWSPIDIAEFRMRLAKIAVGRASIGRGRPARTKPDTTASAT